ncbi:MAG: hypothetical protein FJZ15_00800 [Candidatus Omnitrophica bacterium]|nr:hypothetical protein [Candidatus Omnitrophota bacterium]
MVKFSQIIEGSIEWAVTVCFRPFEAKKWLIFIFVAFMAGSLTGGLNLNYQPDRYDGEKKEQSYESPQPKTPIVINKDKQDTEPVREFIEYIKKANKLVLAFFVILVLSVLIGVIVLFMWLSSRFMFVFLEGVIKNDASVKEPFKKNKQSGNSLFKFYLIFSGAMLLLIALILSLTIAILMKAGAFNQKGPPDAGLILFTIIPCAVVFLCLVFFAAILGLVIRDFVLIIMHKDGLALMQALPKALSILARYKKDFIAYIFVLMGLGILSWMIQGVLGMVAVFSLLFPSGIIGGICYLFYLVVPAPFHTAYFIILGVILVPLVLFVFYCLMGLGLPFSIFFRSLSIKFFGSLEKRYNLFLYS